MATAREILIGECECETCGRAYDFERDGAECSDQCPACAAAERLAAERLAAEAEEAREEAIADARGDVEEIESDLEALEVELAEIEERIAGRRAALKAVRQRLDDLTVTD